MDLDKWMDAKNNNDPIGMLMARGLTRSEAEIRYSKSVNK